MIEAWKHELEQNTPDSAKRAQELRLQIARYEDAGHGSCLLRNPDAAQTVQSAFLHFDGDRYRLLEWCVMPNHVHLLIHCGFGTSLGEIVRSWKTFTARKINTLSGTSGQLWARDYHDRYIRDPDHLANARAYIRNNPVKAGLCQSPAAWPWSSAAWPEHRSDRESPDSHAKE